MLKAACLVEQTVHQMVDLTVDLKADVKADSKAVHSAAYLVALKGALLVVHLDGKKVGDLAVL